MRYGWSSLVYSNTIVGDSFYDNLKMLRANVITEDVGMADALKKLLFFSLLIIIVPISVYFLSKSMLFEATFGLSSTDSYFYAAILSIFVLHIVLALFIYIAWTEGSAVTTYKQD